MSYKSSPTLRFCESLLSVPGVVEARTSRDGNSDCRAMSRPVAASSAPKVNVIVPSREMCVWSGTGVVRTISLDVSVGRAGVERVEPTGELYPKLRSSAKKSKRFPLESPLLLCSPPPAWFVSRLSLQNSQYALRHDRARGSVIVLIAPTRLILTYSSYLSHSFVEHSFYVDFFFSKLSPIYQAALHPFETTAAIPWR